MAGSYRFRNLPEEPPRFRLPQPLSRPHVRVEVSRGTGENQVHVLLSEDYFVEWVDPRMAVQPKVGRDEARAISADHLLSNETLLIRTKDNYPEENI